MTRYKATIAYDGTDFAGFQTQANQRTIQEEIEKVLTKLNSFEPVILHGSGRTDSGVHAFGQVIHFDLKGGARDLERLRFGLDTQTPADIAIKKVELVASDWHSRYHKHEKTYEYYLENARTRTPFTRNSKAYFRYKLDVEAMKMAAEKMVGTYDFTGFTASGSSVDDKIRTIYDVSVEQLDAENLKFVFKGNGFLYKQVRNMVGTLLKIGNGKMPVEQIDKILATKNRDFAGPTAAAEGLYLKEVIYVYDERFDD